MPSIWKFVDQPIAAPTTLLDMNDGVTWRTLGGEFFKLPSPPLKRSIAANAMVDGGIVTSAVYELRELVFTLDLSASSEAGRIAQLDALKAQLTKPRNLLMYQSQLASNPVFFRTLRSDQYEVDSQFVPGQTWRVSCSVLAEPFAIGIRRDLSQVTVANDPAPAGAPINANTSFEVNTTGWTGTGGALTRTTAQFHAGVASATITPDGVTATIRIDSANVAVTGGGIYRARGWLRCAIARTVFLSINWYDSGSVLISTGSGSVAVSANTWTFISTELTAPAAAAFGAITATMTGTPPATHILWVDEIELRAVPIGNPTRFDMTGIVGDSPTPAFVRIQGLGAAGSAVLAQRTMNNPTALTVYTQAESGTLGTDTVLWTSTVMSNETGTSSFFGTNAGLVTRVTVTLPTASSPDALRGRYRVLMRAESAGSVSNFTIRYVQNPGAGMDPINGPQITYKAAGGWSLMDLGIVEFPAFAAPQAVGYSGLTPSYPPASLAIQVARTSGTDTFDIDYIYLLPADERLCRVSQTGALGYLVLDGPNDMAYGMASGSSPFSGALSSRVVDNAGGMVSLMGGSPVLVPGVTNRWYLLVDKQADVAGTKTVDVSYWPRWREVATS